MEADTALYSRLQEALTVHQQGDLARAQRGYSDILAQSPEQPDALHLLGVVHMQKQNFAEAAALIGRSVAVNPANGGAWFNHGLSLLNLQDFNGATKSFDKVIQLQPDNPDAHNNRAIAMRALGHHEEALAGYDKALAIQPQSPETLNNRGVTLTDLARYAEAAESCARAIAMKSDYVAAYNNHGNALRMLHRYGEAISSFDNAIALHPTDAEAFNNRGLVWTDLKNHPRALEDYTRAIALRPHYAEAFNNRAIVRAETQQYDAALADYRTAITLDPNYADAYVNLGHTLSDLTRLDEAIASYKAARDIKPYTNFLHGHLLYARMMICDWQGIEREIAELMRDVAQGARVTSPFPALMLTDDPTLQFKAVETWARAKHRSHDTVKQETTGGSGKIRVGYFSMDFREHPISALTAGLFEAHDRDRFEVYAFSYGPDQRDEMRARLERSFDKFIDVRAMSDAEIVALARETQLDIAVDLAGYTKNARPGIFALRAAPVQVNYLGYPGTLATPHIDYIIADDILIPPESQPHYAEKTVYLPCFQVNDDKRLRPSHAFSREELGLPANGFVFCCFNNTYKFSPDVFAAWMRILERTEKSVLFLYADTETAIANLRREAAAHGITPERLIFGKRLGMADYLARYKAADLFLDTLPYNAGTTASDALWMDLPVLTCTGATFASRMAASLLRALDLPELITSNLEDYENRAVALAADATGLAALKEKLARNRAKSALFNTATFTRNLENAYTRMHERARAGLAPDHIPVK